MGLVGPRDMIICVSGASGACRYQGHDYMYQGRFYVACKYHGYDYMNQKRFYGTYEYIGHD